jgi:hypothetical protein
MSAATFAHLSAPVKGRGIPPMAFLCELVAWGKQAPADIFAPNDEPGDVMGKLCGILGPWSGPLHRKAAMIELLRCLGGFESSWHWNEGVDLTNSRSQAHPESQEAGIFQVSYDSLGLEHGHHTLRDLLASQRITGVRDFIERMKGNHFFAFEYAARLLRINYRWDGPISRGEIDSSLSRDAVAEIMTLLA